MKFTANPRQSLFTLSDHKEYAARRRIMARGFSKTELRTNWEGIVQKRVRLAVEIMIEEGRHGSVDVLKWLILMAMNISTRVVFGEEYEILEAGRVSRSSSRKGLGVLIALVGNKIYEAAAMSPPELWNSQRGSNCSYAWTKNSIADLSRFVQFGFNSSQACKYSCHTQQARKPTEEYIRGNHTASGERRGIG
jgi:cytochrome P450